jgi:hypothetical protein
VLVVALAASVVGVRDLSDGSPADGLLGGPGGRGVLPVLVVVVGVSLAVRLCVLERITVVFVSMGILTVAAREAV